MTRTIVKLTPNVHHLVGIWWAVFWRTFLAGILLNLPVAVLISFVYASGNRKWVVAHLLLGQILYLGACLWAIRTVLRKGFDEYEIWLVARDPERSSLDKSKCTHDGSN